MNRRRFLEMLGLAAAAPVVGASLAEAEALPPVQVTRLPVGLMTEHAQTNEVLYSNLFGVAANTAEKGEMVRVMFSSEPDQFQPFTSMTADAKIYAGSWVAVTRDGSVTPITMYRQTPVQDIIDDLARYSEGAGHKITVG